MASVAGTNSLSFVAHSGLRPEVTLKGVYMLPAKESDFCISTVHLHQFINQKRKEYGESEIRANVFCSRVVDELEGENYKSFVVKNQNKTESTHYSLTIDQAKVVSMRESKGVRKAVVNSLNEREQKQQQFQIPQTLGEALQLAADQAKKLELQAPMVAVYEMLADRKGDVSTTVVAKELGTTSIKLNRFLRDNGIKWQKADLPKAGYETWMNVISDVKNGHEFTQCLVTPKGQIEIAKLWGAQ